MENITNIVYMFNGTKGISELRILADSVEQRNGWVLALWQGQIMGGIKEECLKAFFLEANN
jgi:hypothetical protein